jgi:outer membrane immunogenic protein
MRINEEMSMSRIHFIGESLVAFAAGTATAFAADVPNGSYEAPPAPAYSAAPAFTWSGPYLGIQGGYNWGTSDVTGGSFDTDGWLGGIYGGYNYQVTPSWVVGVEGDASINGADGSNGAVKVENPWDASARLRAGFAVDRFLVYGTGGLAFGEVKAKDATYSDSDTRVGWTLGGGVEAAVTDHVTTRVEYRYTDLGKNTYDLTTPTDVESTSNRLTVGLGFKF